MASVHFHFVLDKLSLLCMKNKVKKHLFQSYSETPAAAAAAATATAAAAGAAAAAAA